MEYRVISEESTSRLEMVVNDFMAEGWKPHGTVFVSTRYDNSNPYGYNFPPASRTMYNQTMVKGE